MQQIIHNIPLIAQEKENQYMAASLAMMLSWKSGENKDISSILNMTWSKDQSFASSGGNQTADDIKEIAENEGMTIIYTLPIKTEDLSLLIFQTPLLAVFFSDNDKKIVYALVITGIIGDGSLTDTFVHIQDPDLVSKGKKYKISLLDFYRQFGQIVAANDNLNLNDINQLFCYYDSSEKMT